MRALSALDTRGSNMPLGPHDIQALASWTMLTDIQRHRDEFIALGRSVYSSLKIALGKTPSKAMVENVMAPVLLRHPLYLRLADAKPHMSGPMYEVFSKLVASYLVDREWAAISGVDSGI
jgi:hypothetical protein